MTTLRDERGFTLTELLVAVAVLAFIMGSVLVLQQQGQRAYLTGAARVEVQQNARIALDAMMNELRGAQGIVAVPNCNSAATGSIDVTFLDQGNTQVRYRLNGTNLERNNEVVIGGVQRLSIWCYAADGTTLTATAGDVRTVHVLVATQTEKATSAGQPTDQHALVEGRVRLRNIL